MTKLELENLVKEKNEEIASLKARVEELENSNHDVLSLEDRIKNLETEKRYLSEAIDAKDKEIWELKKKINEENVVAKNFADKQIEDSKKAFEIKEKQLLEVIKNQDARIKEYIDIINEIFFKYGALIKIIQGASDTAVTLCDYIERRIRSTNGGAR